MRLNFKENVIYYLKYCIVGGIGAIVDFIIFTVVIEIFLINYIIANIFSISVALILVYYLQKNWTFQYQTKDRIKTFQRYLVTVVLTYLFNNCILIVFVELLNYDVILSKAIQIILSTFWGYALTNYFVFATKCESSDKK